MKKLLSILFAGLFAVASTAALAQDKKTEMKKEETKAAAKAEMKKEEAKPAAKAEEKKAAPAAAAPAKKKEKKGGC
jgi:Ni/Co efflux regulator RcnB